MLKKEVIKLKDNFLLNSETAVKLYEKFAKGAPIYDYHCHLSPQEIYEDKVFTDITSVWLKHDHYKWRALRFAGVQEQYITGNGDSREKFKLWAKTCGRLLGSPLYHWANMELQTYFGVKETLNENNADEIYDYCNQKLKNDSMSPIKMILDSNVKLIGTTDDPVDDLRYHKLIKEKNYPFKVLPTFRPDKALKITSADFLDYVEKLYQITEIFIDSYTNFMDALRKRVDYFHQNGCLLSDHSLESLTHTVQDESEVQAIFLKALNGEELSFEEAEKFKNHTLVLLAKEYTEKGWVMQLHIGALRNNNSHMFNKVGVDAGFDIMNDFSVAAPLTHLLGEMNDINGLPKTILYTLNAKDNLVLSTVPHCFTTDGVAGKVQFGAPWWFNDHKQGFMEHFQSLANQSMLAEYIGMLTDSRSFLSYVRHDYFRRILCDYIGNQVELGEFESDIDTLDSIVEGICFKNIIKYLGVE